MTEEALKQGQKIKRQIDNIKEIKEQITPYLHNDVDLTIKKRPIGCALDHDELHYTLMTDSPLFLAISTALQDMIDELQTQFDKLDSNEKEKQLDPIRKTSFWKRTWK